MKQSSGLCLKKIEIYNFGPLKNAISNMEYPYKNIFSFYKLITILV